MLKSFFICILFCIVISIEVRSQSSTQQANSPVVYHPPSADKISWQRLNLWLSSTFILAVKEGQIDLDSCLYMASRSLGLSRFSILAEGIDDPELFSQSQWIDRGETGNGNRLLTQATGKKRLQLLLLLGSYYAFQPGSYFLYRDSVEYYLAKAVSESKVLKEERLGRLALCLLGKIYVQVNSTKGDSIYNQLINQCREAGDKETEARAFAYRGIYMAPMPTTFQQKVADLQKATDLYHNLNNAEGEINTLTDIGYLLIVSGQLQPANEILLKALQLAEAIHYPYTHYNTDALAVVTLFQSKFGEPLRYTLQTIKVAEDSRDSIGLSYFYSRLAQLYNSEGKKRESMEVAQKAIKWFVIDHNPAVYNILNDVAIDMGGENRAKEAFDLISDISKKVNTPTTFTDQFFYHLAFSNRYLNLKMLDLAAIHIAKMDSLETRAEAIRGPLRRSIITTQYAFIFKARGQYRKAREYFEKHFTTTSIAQRSLLFDLSMYRNLISIDSTLGDYASGMLHYKKYTQLLDSNFNVTKTRQAEELQVMYQTQEKENQISYLNQRAKLERANLKQTTLVKNLTIAGTAALLIIAGLLYRQSRLRKKNNTVITHKNEQLQHFLSEKEWLLKEIHHRVKNNLQIVMSLLNSQSAYIDNESALTAIHDSQHRVHAMSLIHQKLYSSENVSSIDMTNYIRELTSYLGESFNTGQRIRFEFDIEPLEMDVSQAVPLGLILNEAITNSIKYAFPGDRSGSVSISLSNTSANHYLLSISDNGVGVAPGIKKAGSLGMSLMKGLSEDLDGNFSIENNKGTTIQISFVHDPGIKNRDTLAAAFITNN
jgi:two-component sensor histidine kinase